MAKDDAAEASLETNRQRIQRLCEGQVPPLAIILGSGLAGLVPHLREAKALDYDQLHGFPKPSVASHAGQLLYGRLENAPVLLLSGRAHYYEKGDAAAMRPALTALMAAGIDTLLLSNAAGSLDENMPAGSLMLIRDHINFSGLNPLIGWPDDSRFVDLRQAYDPALCALFHSQAQAHDLPLHDGVYAWMSGPTFETPAEITALARLGADAVGMSTVPEVIIARHLGLRVAALSVITNLAAGISADAISHDQTMAAAGKASEQTIPLFTAMARQLSPAG